MSQAKDLTFSVAASLNFFPRVNINLQFRCHIWYNMRKAVLHQMIQMRVEDEYVYV